MTWTVEPIQDNLFQELDEGLDLRTVFQNLWQSKKKVSRLNQHLRRSFEELVERHRLYEILKVEQQPGAVRLSLAASKAAREVCRLYTMKHLEVAEAAPTRF